LAEAGRECNDEKLAQQLSLIDHRKSDYTHALARLFSAFTACIARASNESFPESFFASLMMQTESARKRLARARKVNDRARASDETFMCSRCESERACERTHRHASHARHSLIVLRGARVL
jgi:hypothetical protein